MPPRFEAVRLVKVFVPFRVVVEPSKVAVVIVAFSTVAVCLNVAVPISVSSTVAVPLKVAVVIVVFPPPLTMEGCSPVNVVIVIA